jgi:hypothetical protein
MRGLWEDDAQVAEIVRCAKVWPGYDDYALDCPGVLIAAAEMEVLNWRSDLMERVDTAISRHRLDRASVSI